MDKTYSAKALYVSCIISFLFGFVMAITLLTVTAVKKAEAAECLCGPAQSTANANWPVKLNARSFAPDGTPIYDKGDTIPNVNNYGPSTVIIKNPSTGSECVYDNTWDGPPTNQFLVEEYCIDPSNGATIDPKTGKDILN